MQLEKNSTTVKEPLTKNIIFASSDDIYASSGDETSKYCLQCVYIYIYIYIFWKKKKGNSQANKERD